MIEEAVVIVYVAKLVLKFHISDMNPTQRTCTHRLVGIASQTLRIEVVSSSDELDEILIMLSTLDVAHWVTVYTWLLFFSIVSGPRLQLAINF